MKLNYSFLAAALLLCATQVQAQSPTAPALGFQLFVQNDVTLSTSDCDGPIAMGGNLNVNGGFTACSHTVGTFTPPGFSTPIGLLVGGRVFLNSGNFQVNNNGYVKIGTSTGSYVWYLDNNNNTSPIRITPDNSNYSAQNLISLSANSPTLGNVSATSNPVYQSGLINFTTALSTMQASATSLHACTNNMTLYTSGNNGTPSTAPNSIPSNSQIYTSASSAVTVLNIDGTHLNNFQSIAWQLPSGSANKPDASHLWVINVDAAGSYTWNVPNMGLDNSNAAYVIWNFYNTTALTISGNGAVEGQVFAPYATITKSGNNANIEGQVIGLSYNQNGQGGEIHYYPMTSTLAGCGVTAPTAGFSINTAAQCLNGNSFTFTNTGTGSSATYSWNYGDNTALGSGSSATHTYTASGTYTVKEKVTNSGGADSTTHTVVVYATPAAATSFTTSSPTVYQGQRSVTYTIASDTGVTYTWAYSGTGATITGTTNTVTITFSTTATSGNLTVTKTSTHGCGTTTPLTLAILVKPYETFSCTSGSSWNTAGNWDGGFVPYGTISAYIPAVACTPTITVNTDSVNNLIIDAGGKLSIGSSNVLNANGNVTENGTVTGGYLNLSGTSAQTLSGKGTIDELKMTNTSGATINSGDTIHIKVNYQPGSGTVLTTNGGLELLSDSTGTATILNNPAGTCATYISGNVICDKYIHGGRRAFRFFGHPFSSSIALNQLTPYVDITGNGGAANGFTPTATNNPSAFWFNTANGNGAADDAGWTAYTSTDGQGNNAWKKLAGLRLFIRGALGEGLCDCTNYTPSPTTIKMVGPLNECGVTATLGISSTNISYSYNFIGNPYASNINLKSTTRGSKVGTNFCVWDPNQGTQGAYVEQPFTMGTGYILPAYSAFTTTCSSGTSNNTIVFSESCKTSSAASGNLFRTTNDDGDYIHLHVYSGADTMSWDRVLIFFNDQAVNGYDEYDGGKLGNPDLNFYTYSTDDSALAVDQRPFVDGEVVQLGFASDTFQQFRFKVDEMSIPSGGHVFLHDKLLSTLTELNLGVEYSFTVTGFDTTQGDNRFELNIIDTATAVTVLNKGTMHVNVYPNPASSIVNVSFDAPSSGDAYVTISNAIGQQVITKSYGNMKNGTVKVPVTELPAGVYMVTFKCGGLSYTQRFVKS